MQREVEEYLAKSGRHAQLAEHLRQRLQANGWYDSVRTLAAQELAAAKDPSAEVVTQRVEERAVSMVPEEIKVEMFQLIRSLVDQVVEKP